MYNIVVRRTCRPPKKQIESWLIADRLRDSNASKLQDLTPFLLCKDAKLV